MAIKEIAIGKRAAIDKASQKIFLSVGAAAIVLGLAIVGSVYFIKWMVFNGEVIGRKGKIIADYKTIQNNLDQLKINVMSDGTTGTGLANSDYLEAVARASESGCVYTDGTPVDTSDDVELARTCSALRVIPDALPSVRNDEATYASLNKLFLLTLDGNGNPVEPESISPGGTSGADSTTGLSTIPLNLSIENTGSVTSAVLDTIERSIRNIDIRTATISWRSSQGSTDLDTIELRGTAVAYYSSPVTAAKKSEIIYADPDNAKAKGTTKK